MKTCGNCAWLHDPYPSDKSPVCGRHPWRNGYKDGHYGCYGSAVGYTKPACPAWQESVKQLMSDNETQRLLEACESLIASNPCLSGECREFTRSDEPSCNNCPVMKVKVAVRIYKNNYPTGAGE